MLTIGIKQNNIRTLLLVCQSWTTGYLIQIFPCFFLKIWCPFSFSCSYSGRVVGNGLHAQRRNPEVKVRSPNPTLAEVKERLERFNQVGWHIADVHRYAHIFQGEDSDWPQGATESSVCFVRMSLNAKGLVALTKHVQTTFFTWLLTVDLVRVNWKFSVKIVKSF